MLVMNSFNVYSQRDNTFNRLMTDDKTWVHHYEPETRQSMEWHIPSSPKPKKEKSIKSAENMAIVFWDTQGVILVDFLLRGETVNSDSYIDTLKRLWARILEVRPDMDIGNVPLLLDNARPHTEIRTRETIASFEWTTVSHLSYLPDLAPSDYNLFGTLKQGLRGKHYEDDEVKNAVKTWLKEQPIQFYEAGIHALVKPWNVSVE
ncbi:histone-lysine N-methyltransferase SETMAR [Elysia marginata]|uniref:Histone-lysine N-methyltransferase SETMAR n=1 Tax=Elysia marginata TaxID=1093978 RepID=A0AAV4JYB8_9GAST|nr:histone-lysine N-methyltransferase SETMAR [Elysia marginata]